MEGREEKSKETSKALQNRQRRPSCGKCMKPSSVCICSRVKFPPIENSIALTILQHSLEGKHHLNSVRVASLGFKNISVVPVSDVLFQAEYIIRPLDDSFRLLSSVEISKCGNSASEVNILQNGDLSSVPNDKSEFHKSTFSSMKSVGISENGKLGNLDSILHNGVHTLGNSTCRDLPSVPNQKSELHECSFPSTKSDAISENRKSGIEVNFSQNGVQIVVSSIGKDLPSVPNESSELHKNICSSIESVEISENQKLGNEVNLSQNGVYSVQYSNFKDLTSAPTEKSVLHITAHSSMKSVTISENGGLSVKDLPSAPNEKSESFKITCSSMKSVEISENGISRNEVNSFKNGIFLSQNSSSEDLTSPLAEEPELHKIGRSSMRSVEIYENRKCQYGNGIDSKDLPSIPGEIPELYKITCSSNMVHISLSRTARPDLIKALPKELLESFSINGFSVQRIQTNGKRGSKNLAKFEEFHLIIPPRSALLFPGKIAFDLNSVNFDVKHLILLDGTWDKARRMFHENPWLQLLPRIKLAANEESIYKEVRHEPKPGCLSTIESIVCAFKVLGDNPIERLDELLEVFGSMVDDQRRLKEEKFRKLTMLNSI